MKRGLLAAALLLGSAGFAPADYIILVANLGAEKDDKGPAGAGVAGVPPGGMAGMRGVPPGGMAGMRGVPPGGMTGVPPGGMAGQFGAAGMAGMRGGPPGGAMGGMNPYGPGGVPPGGMAGMRGGPPGGMAGMGGVAGMRGGPPGSMGGGRPPGGFMGMFGGMGGAPDVEDDPYFVVAVVEVQPHKSNHSLSKQLADPHTLQQGGVVQVHLPERYGKECHLLAKLPEGIAASAKTPRVQAIVLTQDRDKALPSVSRQFEARFGDLAKGQPPAEEVVKLADWTLQHGLVDKFPQVMDKLAEVDKGNRAVTAYQKLKAELDRPLAADDSAAWRGKLLSGYKVDETPHYALVHPNDAATSQVRSYKERLEQSFRGYYYWFAFKGVALSVPKQRQVVVLTGKADDFKQLQKIFTSGPVVADGFFARRENVAVMASQPQDDRFDVLNNYLKTLEDKYERKDVLKVAYATLLRQGHQPRDVAEVQMLTLMRKALDEEAVLATVSHDASRQLLFASGLLPRKVAVPEWLLSGVGSFFETPPQSPWATIGAPSSYYLPRWVELKARGLEATPCDTLIKVVTDSYFRAVPPGGKGGTPQRHLHDAALRKARTTAWSLTYYLAQHRLPELRNYFTELSKMPRDVELDDAALLGCFARAFGCVDTTTGKVNRARLNGVAGDWYSYMGNVHFDSEEAMKKVRDIFRDKLKEAEKADEQGGGRPTQPGGGNTPFPPGGPGGAGTRPPGAPSGPGGGGNPPRPGGGDGNRPPS